MYNSIAQNEAGTAGKQLLPWLVAVAFFMESLDTTILNTAVPAIAAALNVAPLSMKSVLASYTLSLAVFIPISGWMADRFGTRRVFASAIGMFTLGSLLCGLSSNIHVLVACRILQGCGGAMMVPVGRLTMVRTFAKSELIRAMSFVAIPGLIGPMLGPIAGGLIVGYFHWRVIFFVNIPIGCWACTGVPASAGLPGRASQSARCDRTDSVRLRHRAAVLRAGGFRRAHAERARDFGDAGDFGGAAGGLWISRDADRLIRCCGWCLFRIRTFRASVSGSFFTRLGIGGIPFLFPLLYQVGLGFTPIQSGMLMMPQAIAAMSLKMTMPAILARFGYRGGADFQHRDHRGADYAVRDDWRGYAGVADRAAGVLLRIFHFAAIHEHEHAGLCGCDRGADQQREHHRQHNAADVHQLWRGDGVAGDCVVYPRPVSFQRGGNDHGIHERFWCWAD